MFAIKAWLGINPGNQYNTASNSTNERSSVFIEDKLERKYPQVTSNKELQQVEKQYYIKNTNKLFGYIRNFYNYGFIGKILSLVLITACIAVAYLALLYLLPVISITSFYAPFIAVASLLALNAVILLVSDYKYVTYKESKPTTLKVAEHGMSRDKSHSKEKQNSLLHKWQENYKKLEGHELQVAIGKSEVSLFRKTQNKVKSHQVSDKSKSSYIIKYVTSQDVWFNKLGAVGEILGSAVGEVLLGKNCSPKARIVQSKLDPEKISISSKIIPNSTPLSKIDIDKFHQGKFIRGLGDALAFSYYAGITDPSPNNLLVVDKDGPAPYVAKIDNDEAFILDAGFTYFHNGNVKVPCKNGGFMTSIRCFNRLKINQISVFFDSLHYYYTPNKPKGEGDISNISYIFANYFLDKQIIAEFKEFNKKLNDNKTNEQLIDAFADAFVRIKAIGLYNESQLQDSIIGSVARQKNFLYTIKVMEINSVFKKVIMQEQCNDDYIIKDFKNSLEQIEELLMFTANNKDILKLEFCDLLQIDLKYKEEMGGGGNAFFKSITLGDYINMIGNLKPSLKKHLLDIINKTQKEIDTKTDIVSKEDYLLNIEREGLEMFDKISRKSEILAAKIGGLSVA